MDRYELEDSLKIIGIIICLVILVFVLMYIFAAPLTANWCHRFSIQTGLDTKFDWIQVECYAQYKGIWLPTDQIYQLIGK